MIPILYENTEYLFETNGLGRLSDAISCIVTEERNGAYELAMEYPENGIHASELETDRIIFAKPAAFETEQPFRIYKITKTLNRRIKVNAQHISYDLAYTTVMPCVGVSASNALSNMATNAINIGHFTTWSNVSTAAAFVIDEPASFRNWIGGRKGSILDTYGGELQWDKFAVKLHGHRGTDRGLVLRYGKNISDISQEQDISYTITGITPYLVTSQKVTLTLPEKTIWKSGVSYSPARDKSMNMSSYVDEKGIRETNPNDTEAQIEAKLISAMRTATQAYINANITGTPDAAIVVSYVDLGATEEYKGWRSLFSQAGLCDTVSVYYERLGIQTTSKIVKTEYNVLLDRFEKLTIGKTSTNLASNIFGLTKDAKAKEEETKGRINALIGTLNVDVEDLGDEIEETAQNLQDAIDTATQLITGSKGGYVVISQDANGKPYEILIMDKPTKATATKVWRWNKDGLGYSSTGYSGTYGLAITANGAIVADYITTGSLSASLLTAGILNASLIKTGVLTDNAGRNWWNMSNGEFSFCNGNMKYDLSDGSFIQLKNNLSLKLNGIPLAGAGYNYENNNLGSSTVVLCREIGLVYMGEETGQQVSSISLTLFVVIYPYVTTLFIRYSATVSDASVHYLKLMGGPEINDEMIDKIYFECVQHQYTEVEDIECETVSVEEYDTTAASGPYVRRVFNKPASGNITSYVLRVKRLSSSQSSGAFYANISYPSKTTHPTLKI